MQLWLARPVLLVLRSRKRDEGLSITQFGRVELDPMKVPVPIRASSKDYPSFDEQLQSVTGPSDRDQTPPREDSVKEPTPAPRPENSGEAQSSEQLEQSPAASDQAPRSAEAEAVTAKANALPAEGGEVQEKGTPNGGASARRTNAGKGVEAPSIYSAQESKADTDPVVNQRKVSDELLSQAFVAGSGADKQAGAGNAQTRADGLGLKAESSSSRIRNESPLAGYKTVNKYSLQMTEAARESVFKQIAMRLTPEGGELMMRLDPPELGKINLQMTVEKQGQMRLVITAERSDLAALLEKHMAELEQELQKQGITVTGSEVRHDDGQGNAQSKDGFGDLFSLNREDSANEEESQQNQFNQIRPGDGFITADSLDFWA